MSGAATTTSIPLETPCAAAQLRVPGSEVMATPALQVMPGGRGPARSDDGDRADNQDAVRLRHDRDGNQTREGGYGGNQTRERTL